VKKKALIIVVLFLFSVDVNAQGISRLGKGPNVNKKKKTIRDSDKDPKVIRSKILKNSFYFVEESKYTKTQQKQWEKKCRRKFDKKKQWDEYKACYTDLKEAYLDEI